VLLAWFRNIADKHRQRGCLDDAVAAFNRTERIKGKRSSALIREDSATA